MEIVNFACNSIPWHEVSLPIPASQRGTDTRHPGGLPHVMRNAVSEAPMVVG